MDRAITAKQGQRSQRFKLPAAQRLFAHGHRRCRHGHDAAQRGAGDHTNRESFHGTPPIVAAGPEKSPPTPNSPGWYHGRRSAGGHEALKPDTRLRCDPRDCSALTATSTLAFWGVVHTKVNAVVLFRFIDKKIFQNVLPVAIQSVRHNEASRSVRSRTHGNAAKDPWSARSIRSPHRRVQVPMAA